MLETLQDDLKVRGLGPVLILAGLVLALLVGGGLWISHQQGRAARAEAQAQEHKGRAAAAAEVAQVADQAAADAKTGMDEAQRKVDALRAQLETLRRGLVSPTGSAGRPLPPAGQAALPGEPQGPAGPENPHPDLAPIVQAQDALIQAQDQQIAGLKGQVATLTTARDSWRRAYQEEAARANLLQIALDAQKAAGKGARWRGRIEGLAVGLACGYVGGRLK